MRRTLAESFEIQAVYHCPIWLCNHAEGTKEAVIEHLIFAHTDEDTWNEKQEDKIWNNHVGQG
jgi:hypothetical protein